VTCNRFLALALLVCASLPATFARAEDETLPPDWVAQCAGRVLTRERLALAVANRTRQELLSLGSGPLTILRQMIQERVVQQEATRLGVSVTEDEVRSAYDTLDRQVKDRTNGAKNLRDIVQREQKTSMQEFVNALRHELLKTKVAGHERYLGATLPKDPQQRIAQAEIVMGRLMDAAQVEYGWSNALQDSPADLGPGVVARVNGQPIQVQEYGEQLMLRLPSDQVRDVIVEECKAVLTESVALSVEQMDAVIAKERERWNRFREMTTQEAMRHLSYEDFVKMTYKLDLDDLKKDRYFRGLYGLISRYADVVEPAEPYSDVNGNGAYDPGEPFTDKDGDGTWDPDEVRADYEENKDGLYGESILVSDIQIAFSPSKALVPDRQGRDYREALRMANELLRRSATGIPWDQVVREVNARQIGGRPDPTFRARRLRVRNTGNERILFERAKGMRDGDVSSPFETLSEVHVMRRESASPAPTFAEVEGMIRDSLAKRKAHKWLSDLLEDEKTVKIRWPLPE
jgi:hypothetical protein